MYRSGTQATHRHTRITGHSPGGNKKQLLRTWVRSNFLRAPYEQPVARSACREAASAKRSPYTCALLRKRPSVLAYISPVGCQAVSCVFLVYQPTGKHCLAGGA